MKSYRSLLWLFIGLSSQALMAQGTPEESFKKYREAMLGMDIEGVIAVTHSSYAEMLRFMAGGQVNENVDTVDRIHYESLEFKEYNEGGLIKYQDGENMEVVFLVKEVGQWKIDPMGSVVNYGVGMASIDFNTDEFEKETTYKYVVHFDIAGFTLKQSQNGTLQSSNYFSQFFKCDRILEVSIEIFPPDAPVSISLYETDVKTQQKIALVEDKAVESGKFFYSYSR